MKKIEILPESLANKIAAGEVVQRPDSVVKELMENAIDAQAGKIDVIVKKGGKIIIQVVDNGEGMSEEDALLSIQKHATSKIKSLEDLEAISTLGFRGEALSSISSVSQFELRTKSGSDELGTFLRMDDKNVISREKISMERGTNISVKNLFYNIPARRNFLKTDATELKHISDTFNKIALCYPSIHFRFFNEDDSVYDYSPGTMEKRINDIFGEGISKALIKVEELTDYISLYGYIGKPTLLRKSRGDQYLFLNKRYVISKQINHAVFSAYENILEKGEYPFFILYLDIDPKRIDVNVHPSKLEVRFDDEKDVYSFVLAVVRKSLSTHDLVPNISFKQPSEDFPDSGSERMEINKGNESRRGDFSDRPLTGEQSRTRQRYSDSDIEKIFGSLTNIIDKSKSPEPEILPFEPDKHSETVVKNATRDGDSMGIDSVFIVQLHNKYILSQIKSGLMIIDQHVAHERILYERVKNLYEANLPFSQQLLFPRTVNLDPGSYQLIKEIYPALQKIGFELRFHPKSQITIDGVPQEIKNGSEEEILREIVDEYVNNIRQKNISDEKENIAKSYSCKAAIKAGDKLNENEMRILIDQLFATSMPYVCPHGRPIVVKISLDEFDRRFGRT